MNILMRLRQKCISKSYRKAYKAVSKNIPLSPQSLLTSLIDVDSGKKLGDKASSPQLSDCIEYVQQNSFMSVDTDLTAIVSSRQTEI